MQTCSESVLLWWRYTVVLLCWRYTVMLLCWCYTVVCWGTTWPAVQTCNTLEYRVAQSACHPAPRPIGSVALRPTRGARRPRGPLRKQASTGDLCAWMEGALRGADGDALHRLGAALRAPKFVVHQDVAAGRVPVNKARERELLRKQVCQAA